MHTFIIKSTRYYNLYFLSHILPLHVSTRADHLQGAQCQCLAKVIINYNLLKLHWKCSQAGCPLVYRDAGESAFEGGYMWESASPETQLGTRAMFTLTCNPAFWPETCRSVQVD
jgi:hypothetical protein